jgi:hypothetical protein
MSLIQERAGSWEGSAPFVAYYTIFLGMMLIFLEKKSKQKQETISRNQRSEGEMRGRMNLPPPIFLFFIKSSTYLHRVMIYYCYDAKDRMTGGMGR